MISSVRNSNNTRYKLLLEKLHSLRTSITQQTIENLAPFSRYFPDGIYTPSAINLIHYLILRNYDLRKMQQDLVSLGLSSLGRGEANIIENINKVIDLLEQVVHSEDAEKDEYDFSREISKYNESLEHHANKLLGVVNSNRQVRIMVTLPSEAATNYELVLSLVKGGMNCARINCAHDNKQAWLAMINNIRLAENSSGYQCRIMMDIAGQKIRTGPIENAISAYHIKTQKDKFGSIFAPGNILILPQKMFDSALPKEVTKLFKIAINDEVHASLQTGDQLEFIDTRGKKRSMEVIQSKDKHILIGQCWQNAYITPETVFKRFRHTELRRKYHHQELEITSFTTTSAKIKVFTNDKLLLTRSNIPGHPARKNIKGEIIHPASISISHDEIIDLLSPGNSIWIDDGKIGAIVENITADGLLLNINHAPPKGGVIHANKGLNFPDIELEMSPLTDKDLKDLDFIAEYADIVAYSFVQSSEDMSYLLYELKKRNASHLPVIAKIETKKAVKNLPKIILSTIGRIQLGIMIARGDLAVELGSIRMAEIQEEILWVCEAAHVPVIWATQVLESLAKNGIQSRPEITDAAMSVRAECVLLNKGEHILEALNVLDNILKRMQEHQYKKTSRMRALQQWNEASKQPQEIPFI